jgi:hypothetical protein
LESTNQPFFGFLSRLKQLLLYSVVASERAFCLRFALGDQLLVAFTIEVSHCDPGMRHLVTGSATTHYPLIGIGVVGVVSGVVIPLLDYQYRAGWQ